MKGPNILQVPLRLPMVFFVSGSAIIVQGLLHQVGDDGDIAQSRLYDFSETNAKRDILRRNTSTF